MTSTPAPLAAISIKNLFPTPLVISELAVDAAADINAKLTQLLLEKEKEMPSQHASNRGGWQSDDKIRLWGGGEVETVITAMREILDQITVHFNRTGVYKGGVDWKINGWGNINRKGDWNVPHIHPGAYWSGVYYIATDPDASKGGALQLADPRGGLSLMYCPVLRIGIDGYLTAGNSETVQPRPGQCVIFPSWLSHSVTPYSGDATRMSLAFNFSV